MVGLIAVTLIDLARAGAADTTSPTVSFAIFAAALVLLYLWKSKLGTPVALALGAAAGAVALA